MYINTVFAFSKTLYFIFNIEEKRDKEKGSFTSREIKLDLLF